MLHIHDNEKCPRATNSRCLVVSLLLLICGCIGTPWNQVTSWNPFHQPPPAYKSQYGLTPAQKVDRLRQLRTRLGTLPAAEQQQLCNELIETLQKEADPILRRELVATMGAVPGDPPLAGLSAAIADPDPTVRVAACHAWAGRAEDAALRALSTRVTQDEDVDVKVAAAAGLARLKTPEAIEQLARTLDDRDPAVQVAAMDALKMATGKDLGNDINDWREALKSDLHPTSRPTPELMAQPPQATAPLPR